MNFQLGQKGIQLILAFIGCLIVTGFLHQDKRINSVIWSDQEGYYIYLPALFVHDGFKDVYCANGCTTVHTENGDRIFTKYTYGVSLLESPFFLTAHVFSPWLGYERDGRSLPYIWSVMIAAIFYMLAGLLLLSKLLRELKFTGAISWLLPLSFLLGTNLFYYTFREAGMSHVYSFFMFSLLLYATHRKSLLLELKWDVISAVSLALIILIRPTNAIAVLIPLLWSATTTNIGARISKFASDFRWLSIFGIALFVLFLPQLMYWKAMTGDYLFYSYGDEGFIYWNSPKMLQVLLSPQNGWLVYSPIVLLSFLGLGIMIKNKQAGWILPATTITLATYIFGSWWAWWFGGAYGHRCYVEYLPLLIVPAAFAFRFIQTQHKVFQAAFSLGIAACIFVNLRMSSIYEGMWDGPNWGWYNYLDKVYEVFYLTN